MIQITILKIAGYGPWTLGLGSDREHELQVLQASLYARVQRLYSDRGCLAFPNRADEFFAVTNGLSLDDHSEIQRELAGSLEVGLEASIGHGDTPLEASRRAHEARRGGRVLDAERDICGVLPGGGGAEATIMHLDVDDLTSRHEASSPYEVSALVFGLYSRMAGYFVKRDSLAFFMGGDNFMVVAGPGGRASARDYVDAEAAGGITLNCGIGTAATARRAAALATESLDTIRRIRDSGGPRTGVYELP